MDFRGKDILFIDFESTYSSKRGLGFKDQCLTEYVRDLRFKVQGMAYSWAGIHRTSQWVTGSMVYSWCRTVNWTNTVVVAHNVRFDGAILAWLYKVNPYAWFDTVALAKAVLGENVSNYHLRGLATFLGLPSKGELKWDGVETLTPQQEEDMAVYCKTDTDICRGIYEKLITQFPESQLSAVDWTVRAFLEPKLVLNQAVLEEGIKNEKARREAAISASGVDRSVLASNAQFAELLQQRGFTVPTKVSGRTGKLIPAFARTDDGLAQLSSIAPELYAARIASKANLLETRGESLLAVAKTGAFPFDVGFSGAVQTHRYSGASGAGGNPQNFTRKSFLRAAVCAPSGYSLVVGDFAAVELRILAWLAKEQKLISKIINDADVYSDFASTLYNRPITKADPERAFGKEAILGLGYNMGARKFQARVKTVLKQEISDDEAWRIVKLYRSTYSNVPKLWEACGALIPLIAEARIGCLYFAPFLKVRKNAIVLPSGLAIQYPNLRRVGDEWVYDKFTKKYEAEPVKLYGGKMVENICQALAGELCKEAIIRAQESGLQPVAQIHDEIICIDADPDSAVKRLKVCMEQSPKWWPLLKLKSEVGAGENWNAAKS